MLMATIQWYVAANERRVHIYFNRFIANEKMRSRLSFTKNPVNLPGQEIANITLNLQPLRSNGMDECDIALFCDFLRLCADYGFNNEFREYFRFGEHEKIPLVLYSNKNTGLFVRCRDSGVLQTAHHISAPNEARLIMNIEGTIAGKNLILEVLRACPSPNSLLVRDLLHDR